jgi:hypothetical protein
MLDLYTPVGAARNDTLYVETREIGADSVGHHDLVGEQRIRCTVRQGDSRFLGPAVRRFTTGQVECYRLFPQDSLNSWQYATQLDISEAGSRVRDRCVLLM